MFIAVYGATGIQGGSVALSLLQNKTYGFSVRCITRNPQSDKSRLALAALGAEMVQADGLVRDQVLEDFRGSWGVFVDTNPDDPLSTPDLRWSAAESLSVLGK